MRHEHDTYFSWFRSDQFQWSNLSLKRLGKVSLFFWELVLPRAVLLLRAGPSSFWELVLLLRAGRSSFESWLFLLAAWELLPLRANEFVSGKSKLFQGARTRTWTCPSVHIQLWHPIYIESMATSDAVAPDATWQHRSPNQWSPCCKPITQALH